MSSALPQLRLPLNNISCLKEIFIFKLYIWKCPLRKNKKWLRLNWALCPCRVYLNCKLQLHLRKDVVAIKSRMTKKEIFFKSPPIMVWFPKTHLTFVKVLFFFLSLKVKISAYSPISFRIDINPESLPPSPNMMCDKSTGGHLMSLPLLRWVRARGLVRVSDLSPEPEPETHYCNNPVPRTEKSSLFSPRMEERRKWISDKITSANTEKYLHYGAQETYNRNPELKLRQILVNIKVLDSVQASSCVPVKYI